MLYLFGFESLEVSLVPFAREAVAQERINKGSNTICSPLRINPETCQQGMRILIERFIVFMDFSRRRYLCQLETCFLSTVSFIYHVRLFELLKYELTRQHCSREWKENVLFIEVLERPIWWLLLYLSG